MRRYTRFMSLVESTIEGGTARLRLNRPDVLNALSPALLEELIEKCGELGDNVAVRVVVLEGSGRHFCAGADLPQFTHSMAADPEKTADLGRRAADALAALPQITIATIRGYCIGGALVLSAACDMRVAADDARFSIPELDAGIPLSWGGMAQVVRLLGESVANDLVLSCRRFGADEALRCGFLGRVIPARDFENDVEKLVSAIAAKPHIVLLQTKRKLRDIRAGTFDARDDAADMVAAMSDLEAKSIGEKYIREHIAKR